MIAQVSVSIVSEKELKISLTTEAVELYYFDSWQYSIVENTITVDALFIPGFGSTIAYLNNNFRIPMSTSQTEIYHLVVNVYYTFYKAENLQDSVEGAFFYSVFANDCAVRFDAQCFKWFCKSRSRGIVNESGNKKCLDF